MTDYGEEQSNEIEALESIYHDSFNIIENKPWKFEVRVSLEESDESEEESEYNVLLQFEYTPNYPDEPPNFEVIEAEGLGEEDEEKMVELIKKQIDENLGMVMIFTIVSAVQEFLNDIKDSVKQYKIDEKKRLEEEEEKEEQKKFHGTRVTVENFTKWKQEFQLWLNEKNKEKIKLNMVKKKLTGKEIFMSGIKINEDEVLGVDGSAVEVDESLFEELDELDFGDEEFD